MTSSFKLKPRNGIIIFIILMNFPIMALSEPKLCEDIFTEPYHLQLVDIVHDQFLNGNIWRPLNADRFTHPRLSVQIPKKQIEVKILTSKPHIIDSIIQYNKFGYTQFDSKIATRSNSQSMLNFFLLKRMQLNYGNDEIILDSQFTAYFLFGSKTDLTDRNSGSIILVTHRENIANQWKEYDPIFGVYLFMTLLKSMDFDFDLEMNEYFEGLLYEQVGIMKVLEPTKKLVNVRLRWRESNRSESPMFIHRDYTKDEYEPTMVLITLVGGGTEIIDFENDDIQPPKHIDVVKAKTGHILVLNGRKYHRSDSNNQVGPRLVLESTFEDLNNVKSQSNLK